MIYVLINWSYTLENCLKSNQLLSKITYVKYQNCLKQVNANFHQFF